MSLDCKEYDGFFFVLLGTEILLANTGVRFCKELFLFFFLMSKTLW